jgi:hypothetical protein
MKLGSVTRMLVIYCETCTGELSEHRYAGPKSDGLRKGENNSHQVSLMVAFSSSRLPTWQGQPFAHSHSAPLESVLRLCFFLPLHHPSFPMQRHADFSFAWLNNSYAYEVVGNQAKTKT